MSRIHRAALLLCALPLQLAAAETPLLWAEFKEGHRTHTGALVQAVALSERAGDAALAGGLRVVGAAVQVEGKVSQANGSQWATLGVEVAGDANGKPIDLSRYQSIGIRLASAVPRVLRVRLKGLDPATLTAGCYPVLMQRVGPQATDYVIPLSAFGPEPYCGARGATAEQTLPAVATVEVTVNEPSLEPVQFAVGRIEFLHTAVAMPAAPATSAVAAVAAVTVAPAGPVMHDTQWKLAWADEFNAPAGRGVDTQRWSLSKAQQPTAAGVRAVFADSAKDVAHDGQGHLAIMAHHVADPALRCDDGPCTHASAKLQAKASGAMLYGRVEIRFKAPQVAGLSASLSLLGVPLTRLPWPEGGEIVVVETHGLQPQASVGLYGPGAESDAYQDKVPLAASASGDGFHVAALEWAPSQLRWFIDDVPVKTLARAELPERTRAAFDQWPFLLNVGLVVGADGAGSLPDKLPADARLLVDYVRVFQRDDLVAATRDRMANWRAQRSAMTAAPQKEPQRKLAAAEGAPPQPVRQVICERNNRYGLMMCY